MTKLSEVATVIMGQSPPGKSYNKKQIGLPLLNGAADFKGKKINPVQFCTKPLKTSKIGDILLCIRATIGKITLSDREYCLGRGVAAIRVFDKEVNTLYLSKMLEGKIAQLSNSAKGSTIKGVKKNDLDDLNFVFPSLESQNRIVSIIEKTEEMQQFRKESDKLTNDYLYSVFLEMFGDPTKNPHNFRFTKVQNLLSKSRPGLKCGPFGSALKKREYVETGIPVWTMDNIVDGQFSEVGCLYVNEKKYSDLISYSTENGDIIISRAGTVGKMCVINSSVKKSIISTNLIKLSLDSKLITPYYFVSLLEYFMDKIGRLKTGADGSYTFMNTRIIANLEIPLPPISTQNTFGKIVEQIYKTMELQKKGAKSLNDFSNLLSKNAFRGKID